MEKSKLSKGSIILIAVALAFMVAGSVLLFILERGVKHQEKAVAEAVKPAQIELTLLAAPQCKDCASMTPIIQQLNKNQDLKIIKDELIDYTSEKGAALISQYNITKIPTIILKGETQKKEAVKTLLSNAGTMADDGTFVLREVPPPYLDPASGAIKGKFTLTLLAATACKECYDPVIHKGALENLGMTPSVEKSVESSSAEGKQLIAKYSIAGVPTILLSGDLEEYKGFKQVWPEVGTVEKDGTYIFRAGLDLMGPYQDVKTGVVKNKEKAEKTAAKPPAIPEPAPKTTTKK